MKKFKFSLQPLLDLALSMQEQLKNQMKQNEVILAQLIEELEDLSNQRTDAKHVYLRQVQRGVQAESLLNHAAYIERYTDLINKQAGRIDSAQKEREKLVLEKASNHQELKKLENLHQKQYTQFVAQAKRDEQEALSDMISYRIASN